MLLHTLWQALFRERHLFHLQQYIGGIGTCDRGSLSRLFCLLRSASRPVPLVLPAVSAELIGSNETSPTLSACELRVLTVCFAVLGEVAGFAETLLAYGALEWLLACVGSFMHRWPVVSCASTANTRRKLDLLSALFCLNLFSQSAKLHTYGFSPVWIRTCWSSACWALKESLHCGHWNGLSVTG
jgi:hypothetical protein